MYRREAKKAPSYCGLYWLSIKWTLSSDSQVIYEVVIKAAALSYVRTRSRMKAAHTERRYLTLVSLCLGGEAQHMCQTELKHTGIYRQWIYALHRSNEGLFIWVSLPLYSCIHRRYSEIFIFAVGTDLVTGARGFQKQHWPPACWWHEIQCNLHLCELVQDPCLWPETHSFSHKISKTVSVWKVRGDDSTQGCYL